MGQSNSWICFDLSHSIVDLVVCLAVIYMAGGKSLLLTIPFFLIKLKSPTSSLTSVL